MHLKGYVSATYLAAFVVNAVMQTAFFLAVETDITWRTAVHRALLVMFWWAMGSAGAFAWLWWKTRNE